MIIVDEILATGQYTDKRGRVWTKCPVHPTELNDCWWAYGKPVPRNFEHKPESTIRLLVERDLHRDVCRGLAVCEDHPVPSVNCYFSVFEMWPSGRLWSRTQGREYNTLSAAMDAARALAVGS